MTHTVRDSFLEMYLTELGMSSSDFVHKYNRGKISPLTPSPFNVTGFRVTNTHRFDAKDQTEWGTGLPRD